MLWAICRSGSLLIYPGSLDYKTFQRWCWTTCVFVSHSVIQDIDDYSMSCQRLVEIYFLRLKDWGTNEWRRPFILTRILYDTEVELSLAPSSRPKGTLDFKDMVLLQGDSQLIICRWQVGLSSTRQKWSCHVLALRNKWLTPVPGYITASTLSSISLELGRHQEHLVKLRDELVSRVSDSSG